MLRKLILLIALVLIVSVSFSQSKRKDFPKVNFTRVGDSVADTLEFKATVKSIYKCPPCPEGAQCKPCIGDHVEVTDGSPDHRFRVFTYQLSLFKIGNSYRFLVRFRSKLHREDNIELVSVIE